jgi:hypothetical protein
MKTDSFTPSFTSALLENVIVFIGLVIGVPVVMLARGSSHPGMTLTYAVIAGLVGGVVLFTYYTVRFVLRVPRNVLVSESALVLHWRNGSDTQIGWDHVQRAVFRQRWGYRWKFFLGESAPILWGDGFSAETWDRMSALILAQLSARSVAIETYDLSGRRVV